MNKNTFITLEYEKIKDKLKQFTVSELGKKNIDSLEPYKDIKIVKRLLKNTSEAKAILNRSPYVPLHGLHDIEDYLQKIEKGGILYPSELMKVSDFLRGSRKMKKFMLGQKIVAPELSSYSYSITELKDIEDEINLCIEGNRVSDKASSRLAKIRKKVEIIEGRIEQKLDSIVNSSKYKSYLQDFFISKRNGRFVIPIKAAYKNMINGNVIDKSSTGSTVFIEPASIAKLSNELISLKAEEEAEEYQVLATISGFINMYLKEIKINVEVMAEYDFVFAKGKYSNYIGGNEVEVNDEDYIKIRKGRHPLLENHVVPLDFEIGDGFRTLVITGPNTGGKTVALKTIGLLTLMVQSGLHIPVEKGTIMAVFERILTDIGDSQSIEHSLSTFSGHIKNIIGIMKQTTFSTLVLLDEIGTGTDPTEGAVLAAAILDELYRNGAITVVTTHYGEIKDYSKQHIGFENGCMEFDSQTLKPLYKLLIGKSGESNALWISERLGMKDRVLKLARKYLENRQSNNNLITFDIEDYQVTKPKRKKSTESKVGKVIEEKLNVGDSVILLDSNKKGIVYKTEDEYGDVVIFNNGSFIKVNRKRVKLYIKKELLYPDDYDLDTIFIPWRKRKLDKDVKRGAVRNSEEFKKRVEELDK